MDSMVILADLSNCVATLKAAIASVGVAGVDWSCATVLLAKLLSMYILCASLVSKLPQIRVILTNRATTGLASTYIYLNVFLYMNSALYNFAEGNPISAYGELWIVSVQNVLMVLLFWRYSPAESRPAAVSMVGMFSFFGAYVTGSLALPPEQRYLLPSMNLPIMVVMRMAQVCTNVRNGHTGLLSITSLIMNVSSVLVRVFTTVVLVGFDFNLLRPQALSVGSNAFLIAQIIYYRKSTSRVMATGGVKTKTKLS